MYAAPGHVLTECACIGSTQVSAVAVAERVGSPDASMANPGGAISAASVMASLDDDDCSQESRQCVQALREGKRCAEAPVPVVSHACLHVPGCPCLKASLKKEAA